MSSVIAFRVRLVVAGLAFAIGLSGCKKDEVPVSPRNESGFRKEQGFRIKPDVSPTPEQTAIFAFLDEDKKKFKALFENLPADIQPPAYSKLLADYVAFLNDRPAEEVNAFPSSFKTRFDAYKTAANDLLKVIRLLPEGGEGYKDKGFTEALTALFNKDYPKARNAVGGDVTQAFATLNKEFILIYAEAGKLGLDVDN
ncbi:MAG: hypothetical protein ACRC7O_18275 [Fimbriiglobus sp.]